MIKNYLKTFWKVAWQNKLFTFLSLFGISLTIMFVMIFSMTVDKVVNGSGPEKNLRNILLSNQLKTRTQKPGSNEVFSGLTAKICEDYMKKIKSAELVSMYWDYEWEFMQNGKHYTEGFMVTDAEFWKIFNFKFLIGNPYTVEEVVNKRNYTVITESLKEVLFGNEKEVLGKTIKLLHLSFIITGVVEDPSPTSQNLRSGLFFPYTVVPDEPCPTCFAPAYTGSFSLAFLAHDRSKFAAIRKEVQGIITRLDAADSEYALFLRGPNTQWENLLSTPDPEQDRGPWGKLRKYLLWGLGFIFLPAINLMALNLARIKERGEEIAIRKSFGASSGVLRNQFLFENILLTLAGGVIGILLSFVVVALLGDIFPIPVKAGTTVPMSFSFDFLVFGISLGVCLLFGVLSGVLPAIHMSGMKPAHYLKGGEI